MAKAAEPAIDLLERVVPRFRGRLRAPAPSSAISGATRSMTLQHRRTPASAHGLLIGREQLRVLDRAVMVHLAPVASGVAAEEAAGADGEIEGLALALEAAALASDGPEHTARDVQRVVAELDVDPGGTCEDALIDRADSRPAALDAAQRIVHRGFGR